MAFDIAQYSIEKRTSSWLFAMILLIGGAFSFAQLGQLEDPEFTIKQAMIITRYPGASPEQVEQEVSYQLENAIQQLSAVDKVRSISSAGLSQIVVDMKSTKRKEELRQIWDELRRKINDVSTQLNPGIEKPIVKDDFGDVFGILLAVTGAGYQYDELKSFTDYLRRELVLVDGVAKVTVEGNQQEQVIVEISRRKLVNTGLSLPVIYQILSTQNQVSQAGKVQVGSESIRFNPTGEFNSVKELESLVISSPGAKQQILLGDVATVRRDYVEVPSHIMRYNGHQALSLGISFTEGVNVVEVGKRVDLLLKHIQGETPVGMQIDYVYNQPFEVENSVANFLISLLEAVAIVIVVLLLFMGLRTGLLIGLILLITVVGSFIFMKAMDIQLQRVSLGALIIALGMLVDNAIVIAEGILTGMKRRLSMMESASLVVKQTKWPLFGATIIAITAFAPIGLSSDATGEFAGSLFWVLLISLSLSWVTAITLTPFFASLLLKDAGSAGQTKQNSDANKEQADDIYQHGFYAGYKKLLGHCLYRPKTTLLAMLAILVSAVMVYGSVKQSFFPDSNTPMFMVDIWHKQGTDIRYARETVEQIEQSILALESVTQVTATIGRGAPRFILTYQPEKNYAEYAQLIIRVENKAEIAPNMKAVKSLLETEFTHVEHKFKRVEIGPSTAAKIEARISGSDPLVLKQLSEQVKSIMLNDGGARNIRDDWRQQVKVIRPVFNEAAARRVGITKSDIDDLLQMNFSGKPVGRYREGTQTLPIIVQPPAEEHLTIDSLMDLQIYSDSLKRYVPITNVVKSFELVYEDPLIMRRDRKRTLTVLADHDIFSGETAAQLFARIKPKIEALPLPAGYEISWGGEFEASTKAQKALFSSLPLGILVMFVITILLFDSFKSASVIWVTVPFALVGVSYGLFLMGKPFGFMALLGFLSLSGMLIKNGIVLVEQIKIELEEGKKPNDAVINAALSRVRPVSMAAITTILGMIPLVFDDFFASMSVVIMFGLGFATVLTLVLVPVMYSLIYKVKVQKPLVNSLEN